MFATIIKPLPLIFTLATTLGVLVHDTQIDRAASVAIALPVALVSYAAIDSAVKSNDPHLHVERAAIGNHLSTLRATLPRLQPRDDDRRYVQSKKLYFDSGDTSFIWPSV